MRLDNLRTLIRSELDRSNVYRTDVFITRSINYGQRLIAVLTLFDERRGSVSITGGRNYIALPKDGNAICIVPLYVANTSTGARVHCASVDEMEFYSSAWEGKTETDTFYYTLLSPFSYAYASIVLCPYPTANTMTFSFVGAFEPVELSADSDEPRLPEEYQDLLVTYTKFESFIGEPGKVKEAMHEFELFLTRLNEYIASIKARFPGGRDFEPYSSEFSYTVVTKQEQVPQKVEKQNER